MGMNGPGEDKLPNNMVYEAPFSCRECRKPVIAQPVKLRQLEGELEGDICGKDGNFRAECLRLLKKRRTATRESYLSNDTSFR